MNVIDEWLDSDGAKRDAQQFKNSCYIIGGRGCGKSYYKELINSAYGRKKSQHDAIASAIKEFDMKQREERLEKAKLTNEEIKEMLFNSRYGICWPSELIESCERIDKYRKEETKDMSRNEMLKNIVGSDIYIKKDDNIMYVGRGESLDFDIHACELTGNISFVADDEPLEDELRKISRSFIKKVIFNNPATIVFWRDGSKTIVKMNGKDKKFDPEKGLAMAIAKKCLGNEGNYYNTFTKFLPEEKDVKKSAKK